MTLCDRHRPLRIAHNATKILLQSVITHSPLRQVSAICTFGYCEWSTWLNKRILHIISADATNMILSGNVCRTLTSVNAYPLCAISYRTNNPSGTLLSTHVSSVHETIPDRDIALTHDSTSCISIVHDPIIL